MMYSKVLEKIVQNQHTINCAAVRRLFTVRCALPFSRNSTSSGYSNTLRLQLRRSATVEPQNASRVDASATGIAASTDTQAKPEAPVDADDELLAEGEIPPEVEQLFGTLRNEALRRLDEFGPIHLFSLCWAYSTARLLDEELEKQISDAALRLGQSRDREPPESSRERKDRKDRKHAHASNKPERAPASQELNEHAREVQHETPSVLQESEHWMVLYKPPFWQVSVDSKEAAKAAAVGPFEEEDEGDMDDALGPEETRKRPRVQGWIQQSLGSRRPIHRDAIEAFGLLHRLDVQTSGILMCAKTYVGAYWLRLQWCSYAVDKEYICLVHGWVDRSVREIHKRIRVDKKKAPNSRRTISTQCSISDSGKPSFTELFTLAHLEGPPSSEQVSDESNGSAKFSLVALKLHTGRTHQIRVHMKSIGHPLVCDAKYGENQFAADRAWCPRNFLHTYRLAFDDVPSLYRENLASSAASGAQLHESSNKSSAHNEGDAAQFVEVFCPLPHDLRTVLSRLTPADVVSTASHGDWVSGERGRLQRFEEYVGECAEKADSHKDHVSEGVTKSGDDGKVSL